MGRPLHARVSGTGDAVLLLHGFGLDGRMWAAQQAALGSSYRTIAVDLPGFGRSPSQDGLVADAIAATLDATGVTTAHVVGLSLGAAVALDLALGYPTRVRSLTVADPLLLGYPAAPETFSRCAELARGGRCAEAIAHWKTDGVFALARTRPEAWKTIEDLLNQYDCGHWTGAATIRWVSTKPRPRLQEIRTPTLVVVGEHDTPGFQAMAEVYASEIREARKVVIPGVGHVSSLEEPAAFSRVLAEFFAGL